MRGMMKEREQPRHRPDRASFSLEARFRSTKECSGTKFESSYAAFSLSTGILYRASARERCSVRAVEELLRKRV